MDSIYSMGILSCIQKEYELCADVLKKSGVISRLPKAGFEGIVGIDGDEYPLPSVGQVEEVFSCSRKSVSLKISQGFNRLVLIPMAMPILPLIGKLKEVIIKHGRNDSIYRTSENNCGPLIPVNISSKKQVWVWDTLKQAIREEKLIYFPQSYGENHGGQSKLQVIHNKNICPFPGWSLCLAESFALLPGQGKGRVIGKRKQLETGNSPREYLQLLKGQDYALETGKTIEDFIIEFIFRLETAGEISNDRDDGNSLWFLGNYIEYNEVLKSDLVPTGWWHRRYGRLRMDAHRPGNKKCTNSWGASTMVRLAGI